MHKNSFLKKYISKIYRFIVPAQTQQEFQNKLRSKGVVIGTGCRIFSNIDGPECYLIEIGNNVTIATGARLITHDNSISKVFPGEFTDTFGRIKIGDNSFIGAFSTILCGVSIGENSIVGAGSLVVRSIPAGEVWGGIPAKKICNIQKFKESNEKYGISTKGMTYEEKKQFLLSSDRLISK